jgi:hypothetical protein
MAGALLVAVGLTLIVKPSDMQKKATVKPASAVAQGK